MEISYVDAFQIFDSRGNPTLEARVGLKNGVEGRGLVPSGASTGQFEALELRDGNSSRFKGRSVFKAIEHVKSIIAPVIIGKNVLEQETLDREMIAIDGTSHKSRLGANAILGVSMAIADAAARLQDIPLYERLGEGMGNLLPLPEIQIIGGGAHAAWRTDIQDFLIIATGARSYTESLEMTFNIYQTAGEILKRNDKYCGLADEGGYWPMFDSHEEILGFLVDLVYEAGYTPGQDVAFSLDLAASDFYDGKHYHLKLDKKSYSPEAFAQLLFDWCRQFPIISLEDPMADTDFKGWKLISDKLGDEIQLIGDDLFTTDVKRIERGIREGIANAVLIKPNQVGTVTETLQAIKLTQQAGWLPVISARSGETEDTFISHLAVATNAGQIKVGAFARGERMAKWNELIRIERHLGTKARFLGANIFNTLK